MSSGLRIFSCTSTRGTVLLTHHKLPSNAVRCLLSRSLLSFQVIQEASQNPDLLVHSWIFTVWDRAVFIGISWHKGPCPQVMDRLAKLGDRTEAVTLLRYRALLYCSSHMKELV